MRWWRAARNRRRAATIAAFVHALALNQLFLEASLLSETLATFLLTLSFYLVQRASEKHWAFGTLAGAGGVAAFAALTRPVSALAGVVLAAWTMIAARGRRLAATGAFLICFSVPVLAWCAFNQAMIGQFGMSTLIGLTLTNHSGAFIERAPDEYATLRDIYLAYREKHIAASGTHRMTIFEARQEMKERTGFTDAQLSRELSRMSVKLFKAYPLDYLRSVAEAWAAFWTVPIPVMDDLLRSPGAALRIGLLSRIQTCVFRIGYVAFLLLSVPTLWIALWRKKATDAGWNCAATIVILVLGMSVAQALLEFGGNGRYAIPTQSLAMAAVIIASTKLLGARDRLAGSPRAV